MKNTDDMLDKALDRLITLDSDDPISYVISALSVVIIQNKKIMEMLGEQNIKMLQDRNRAMGNV